MKVAIYQGEGRETRIDENRSFQPGDSLVLAELEGLKIGILICDDVEFPEAVRLIQNQKVRVRIRIGTFCAVSPINLLN